MNPEDKKAMWILVAVVLAVTFPASFYITWMKSKSDAESQERCEVAGGVIIKGGACVDPSIVRPVPNAKEAS